MPDLHQIVDGRGLLLQFISSMEQFSLYRMLLLVFVEGVSLGDSTSFFVGVVQYFSYL